MGLLLDEEHLLNKVLSRRRFPCVRVIAVVFFGARFVIFIPFLVFITIFVTVKVSFTR